MKNIIKCILINCSYLPNLRSATTSLKARVAIMSTTTTTPTPNRSSDLESIRDKFETNVYNLLELQELISMDHEGVYVNEEAPNQDIINFYEHLNNTDKEKGNVPTQKLKATGHADWGFSVRKLPVSYFRSRDVLEELMISKKHRHESKKYCIQAAKMSMREIMNWFFVSCSCNMQYYLANKSELEADLGRSLSVDFNATDDLEVRRLEQELFYVNMCKIFGTGGDEDDKVEPDGKQILYDKSYMLKDFSVISFDGNEMHATAVRDNNYFIFLTSF